jgi:hypothetical protein
LIALNRACYSSLEECKEVNITATGMKEEEGAIIRAGSSDKMGEGSTLEDQDAIDLIRSRIAPPGGHCSEAEREENQIPSTDNIGEFLAILRKTPEYERLITGIINRAREKTGEEVAVGEARGSLEGTNTFWSMVVDFGAECLHLRYNPQKCSLDFAEKIEEYKEAVRKGQIATERRDADAIAESDLRRSIIHNQAANVLSKTNVVKDEFAARAIVRLLLIDQGLDYVVNARESGIVSYYGIDKQITGRGVEFSTETRRQVRQTLLERHKDQEVVFVDKTKYLYPPQR